MQLPDGGCAKVAVYSNGNKDLPIADSAIVWKLGSLLLPELHKDAGLEGVRDMMHAGGARFSGPGGLVDIKRGALSPLFMKRILDAASATAAGTGAAQSLPWPALDRFVSDVCELDTEQKGQGLSFFRLVFGINHAFMVVDGGSSFSTNNNKTGLFDPVKDSKKAMRALPAIWTALAANLPDDYAAVLSEFMTRRDKAAADKAAKAAAAAAAKAAKAAAADKDVKGGGSVTLAASARDDADGGAGGSADQPHSGRGKRTAAIQAAERLAGAEDDVPEDAAPPRPKKRAATGKASATANKATDPALLAENGQLKARVSALENENASLKAQLLAAGIKPKK